MVGSSSGAMDILPRAHNLMRLDDSDVDDASMMDFFNDDLWPEPKYDDPESALDAAIQGALTLKPINS